MRFNTVVRRSVTATLAAAACMAISACTGGPEGTGHVDVTGSPGPQTLPLPAECATWADPPQAGSISIPDPFFRYKRDWPGREVWINSDVVNTTDLTAVDVRVTFTFLIDGKDVSGEIGGDFQEQYTDYVINVSPNTTAQIGATFPGPPGWAEAEVTFKPTITVAHWCAPFPETVPTVGPSTEPSS